MDGLANVSDVRISYVSGGRVVSKPCSMATWHFAVRDDIIESTPWMAPSDALITALSGVIEQGLISLRAVSLLTGFLPETLEALMAGRKELLPTRDYIKLYDLVMPLADQC